MSVNQACSAAEPCLEVRLLRLTWLLNATAASFTEVNILLQEVPQAEADLQSLLTAAALPSDRRSFLCSELENFRQACALLKRNLEEAERSVDVD